MGISTGYIGILQVVETLKIILGFNKECKNFLMLYNLITREVKNKQIHLHRNSKNHTSKQNQKSLNTELDLNHEQYIVIDLRGQGEFQKKHVNRSINIPLLNLKIDKTIQIIKYYFKYIKIGLYCNENQRSLIGSYILTNYKIINFILDKNMIR